MKEGLGGVVVRLTVFLAVCLLGVFGLYAVFGQLRFGEKARSYNAEFVNVTGLENGDFVRIAGVEVGQVKKVEIQPDTSALVEFTADDSVVLTEGSRAVIRYDDLIGGRYLALEEGTGGTKKLNAGDTIPLARTSPALDLDALIGGFRPLFRALDPEQVNALSGQLIAALQGQGGTINSFLAQTAALTNTLADRDQLIGEVIVNLNVVLGSLGDQNDQFAKAVDALAELVQGLAARKEDISNGLAYTNAAAAKHHRPAGAGSSTVREDDPGDRPGRRNRGGRPRILRQSAQHIAGCLSSPCAARHLRRLLQLLSVRHRAQAQRQGRPAGVRQGRGPEHWEVRAKVKPFSERNLFVIGAIGLAITVGIVVGALQYDKLPFLNQGKEYSAYFAEAGGITGDAGVQVSGFQVGKVTSIELDGPRVLIKFTVKKNIRLGDRTEAAIKTKGLLGTKILEVYSRGDGQQDGTIPLDRTTSPYQLPDALGELATTISGLNTNQLSDSLRVLSETFSDTPPELRIAVEGVARFSETLNERDAQLRGLLTNADKTTTVLAERSNQIVGLVANTNALLAELQSQSAALDQISGNVSALSQQLQGFIGENRATMKPALDKLNGVLTMLDNRKERLQTLAQTAHPILDVARRIGGIRALLQDLCRESAAGTVRAAVHRCRVLRPRSGSQRAAAFGT